MKKVFCLLLIGIICISYCQVIFAANEYSFDLEYTGNVVANQEKDVDVLLVGTEATVYNTVRIKVDITGPSTPKFIAYDSNGTKFDIAQIGYWGPENGFQVGGTFTNRTPVKATFSEAGTYTITLSLLDLANANAVITTKTVTINVFEDSVNQNNTIVENNIISNNIISNNVVSELPKTGVGISDYIISFITLFSIIGLGYIIMQKKR